MRWRQSQACVVVRITCAAALVWPVSACTGSGSSPVATRAPTSAAAPSPTSAAPGTAASGMSTRAPASSTAVAQGLSATCAAGELRSLVDRFVRAFNAGDRPELERLWAAQGQGFSWYSTDGPGQRIGSVAMDRASLGGYFARRHAAGEHLAVTSFQDNGSDASSGNFGLRVVRRADDLPSTAYQGKGAAFCQDSPATLSVWSMARTTSGDRADSGSAAGQF